MCVSFSKISVQICAYFNSLVSLLRIFLGTCGNFDRDPDVCLFLMLLKIRLEKCFYRRVNIVWILIIVISH